MKVPASTANAPPASHGIAIPKAPTGIEGFDQISRGGLPRGRLTAIVGAPGAGKTVFAIQTMVNRLTKLGEPCIFVTFEEPIAQIRANVALFEWAANPLAEPPETTRFHLVDARVPEDAVMTGAFDLKGLLAVLTALTEETGARNIVFDGIDMLLSSLHDEQLERTELLRLDAWIRKMEISAIVTVKTFGTRDREQVRADFLQYMTDCLIILAETVTATGSSRTIRIGKYRGSGFAANPVPIVIGASGINVIAIKSERIGYPTFADRVSTGIARLDALLNGGYLRGNSVLISGSPGTSKTSLGVSFAAAACGRGDRVLLVSFDEGAEQIVANMVSIGIDLAPFVDAGLLTVASFVSAGVSPEEHLIQIRDMMDAGRPDCLVIDPISALMKADYPFSAMICEDLLNMAKSRGTTVVCTSLLDQVSGNVELSASTISTIADTWLHVSYVARDGERNRAVTIIKSRGTGHSNQVRELVLGASGIDLVDVYVAEGEVLMGSARAQKEAEVERLHVLDEIAAGRLHVTLERELSEARSKVEAATLELGWKQREADLSNVDEASRLEVGRAATRDRLDLRRVKDDIPTAEEILGSASSGNG
ncbi:circadian clock protein KaiC [Polymorphobacter megasporae]|uniref:circadian clock protein KaiC n=1 Tax=Glacieibacterium megasporae TaxID=2835787 RepID=UPI001C1DD7ED|nr:circadian clock protein KaiC [Polymorphobacter megasporae]UAJ08945.1 circadian clock protein KaiC [Polymorphobacter megasporae]